MVVQHKHIGGDFINKEQSKTETNQDPNEVRVITKALSVIRALHSSNDDMGLTEISKKAKVNKTTCYRILYTLMSDSIVEVGNRPGTYRLGLRLLELGGKVQRKLELRRCAISEMVRLANNTEETVSLYIMNEDKATCIERIEGRYFQVLAYRVGDTWPLYLGAASRTILAGLPDDKINEILSQNIVPRTSKTPTDPRVYWNIIEKIRQDGYSIYKDDVTLGVTSIGAPIYEESGHVIGAISISTSHERVPQKREKELLHMIQEAAQYISQAMGYHVVRID